MPTNRSRAIALGLLLTCALCGCTRRASPDAVASDSGSAAAANGALAMSTAPAPALVAAPPVTALPRGTPVQLAPAEARGDSYGYLDRATYQSDALEDAPPDYSFDEGGVQHWTWETDDGARVISEPADGGYRTYYYNAGADLPYLVRGPQYAYAYQGGALIAVFTRAGAMIDPGADPQQRDYAGRYLDRGRGLWRNAATGEHQAVNARAWSEHRADLAGQRIGWQRNIGTNPEWSAWNRTHRGSEQGVWDDTRTSHHAAAVQFNAWQAQRFVGPAPTLYPAPDDRADPSAHHDHTAAIVGGVVAEGVVAGAVHAAGQHAPPHPTMGPAAAPRDNHHLIAAPDHRADPNRPATPAAAPHGDHAAPPRPQPQPIAQHSAALRQPPPAAPREAPRPAPPAMPREAPVAIHREAPPAAPRPVPAPPRPEAPRPAPVPQHPEAPRAAPHPAAQPRPPERAEPHHEP